MFAAFGLLLCLVSLSQSFPVCEKLVGPKAGLTAADLNGTWAIIAGTFKDPFAMNTLKQRDSVTAFFSDNNDTWSYTQGNRYGAHCQYGRYDVTFEGSRFTFDLTNGFIMSGYFLYTTCPDCLVMQWMLNASHMELYLLSRRRTLTQNELEEFKAQARCFQLHPPVNMNPVKPLCPEKQEN